ncbi:MAG: hypothetical protein EOM69_03720 [Clostridia bacterium]|nr:hypothetical protein [Clostridia bacterium]
MPQSIEKAGFVRLFRFEFDFLMTCASKNHLNPPIFLKKAVKPRHSAELSNCRKTRGFFRQAQAGITQMGDAGFLSCVDFFGT